MPSSLSSSGGEARGFGAIVERAFRVDGPVSGGVRDLRCGVARSPVPFALKSGVGVAPFVVACRAATPFVPSLIPRPNMSEALLLGLCDSATLDGGSRLGLKRARLAFVGDMKEARRLELGSPSWDIGRVCVFCAFTAMAVEGDVFLRLFEKGSMVSKEVGVGRGSGTMSAYSSVKCQRES